MRLSQISLTVRDSKYFDVIIAGGGMVGSAMACALGIQPKIRNKSVLLLDAGNQIAISKECEAYSNRVSAINPGSKAFFEKIGVWNNLLSDGKLKVVKQLRVWDSCSTSNINFEYDDFAHDVAYIIENNNIIESCVRALQTNSKNVTVKYRSKVTKVTLPADLSDLARIELDDGSKFETSLLVGADGVQSRIRSAMSSHYVSWSYDQKAIVATLHISTTGDNSIAWQRFTPTGPVALLPLNETKSSLVWATTPEEAERLMALPCDQFVDELNKTLWDDRNSNNVLNDVLLSFDKCAARIAPDVSKVVQLPPTVIDIDTNSRARFSVRFWSFCNLCPNKSSSYWVKFVFFMRDFLKLDGFPDAAHRIHPLAGQGVNLGFGDCEVLAELVQKAHENGADIGSLLYLKDYESKRQSKNLPVMLTMDALNRLYRTDFLPIVAVRSLGLNFTNYSAFLKKFIIKQASLH